LRPREGAAIFCKLEKKWKKPYYSTNGLHILPINTYGAPEAVAEELKFVRGPNICGKVVRA